MPQQESQAQRGKKHVNNAQQDHCRDRSQGRLDHQNGHLAKTDIEMLLVYLFNHFINTVPKAGFGRCVDFTQFFLTGDKFHCTERYQATPSDNSGHR
jgi:hypothetical protein